MATNMYGLWAIILGCLIILGGTNGIFGQTAFNYIGTHCTNSSTFALNSTYNSSINILLRSLSANATANRIGYYHTSVVGGDDTVHGYYLCRGDLDVASCAACVSTMVTERPMRIAPVNCPTSKRETIYYDKCMFRYSNETLYGKVTIYEVTETTESAQDITENRNEFKELLGNMFHDLASKAAANNKTGKNYYATAVKTFPGSTRVYALVQCTPDLSVVDCNNCLNYAVSMLKRRRAGEYFMTPSCNTRYETYPFFQGATDSPPPPANYTSSKKNSSTGLKIGTIIVTTTVTATVLIIIGVCCNNRKKVKKYDTTLKNHVSGEDMMEESLQYDIAQLQSATNNFANDNILGEGGFGIVYKGTLWNGQDIAVKRLSGRGHQGEEEFKNEVLLVAKLQHKNLVRLLGFCLTKEERLLVYEYVPNKSLDRFLFEQSKDKHLDWRRRYQIIGGIARGMLYLHEDSRLKIIHRDLKASNILLDANMNPKVADFGTARIVEAGHTHDCTSRIVGTRGYMAPEYIKNGTFSVQSDVYSFGILVLEIISGRRSNGSFQPDGETSLKDFAWKHWRENTPLEFVDPCIRGETSLDEVTRCINLGLLSVQDPDQRPSMSRIVLMLDSFSTTMPTLVVSNERIEDDHLTKDSTCQSLDDASITMPR